MTKLYNRVETERAKTKKRSARKGVVRAVLEMLELPSYVPLPSWGRTAQLGMLVVPNGAVEFDPITQVFVANKDKGVRTSEDHLTDVLNGYMPTRNRGSELAWDVAYPITLAIVLAHTHGMLDVLPTDASMEPHTLWDHMRFLANHDKKEWCDAGASFPDQWETLTDFSQTLSWPTTWRMHQVYGMPVRNKPDVSTHPYLPRYQSWPLPVLDATGLEKQ